MICSGKQVEIEGFDLQSKSTLISKCIYIQKLLADANLSETNLDTDPIFTKSGKAVLLFISQKTPKTLLANIVVASRSQMLLLTNVHWNHQVELVHQPRRTFISLKTMMYLWTWSHQATRQMTWTITITNHVLFNILNPVIRFLLVTNSTMTMTMLLLWKRTNKKVAMKY